MRHRTYFNGGYNKGGLTINGVVMGGPLFLSRDPELPREAATKQYVDYVLGNVNAESFTRGTVDTTRFPAFEGDVTKPQGENLITLLPSGVIAGTYTKYRVDANGRIIEGLALQAADIPNLPWAKVKTNAPTTLAGFGITNALTHEGGTFNGALILNFTPNTDNHMVNKNYVDTMVTDANRPGDIILMTNTTAPVNYLECNGALVNINQYPALYNVISTLFNPVGGVAQGTFTLPNKTPPIPGTKYYIRY